MDELPELDEIYSVTPKIKRAASIATTPQSRHAESPAASITAPSNASNTSEDPAFAQSASWTPRSAFSGTQFTSPAKRRRTNESDRSSFHSITQNSGILATYSQSAGSFTGSPVRQEDAIDSLLRAADYSDHGVHQTGILNSPSQTQISPYNDVDHDTPRAWPQVSIQEACLMRYFIDELACWVRSLMQFRKR